MGLQPDELRKKLTAEVRENILRDNWFSHECLHFSAVTFFSIGHGDVLCSQLAMMTALANNMVNVVRVDGCRGVGAS
jgi:hypothetical protein